MASVNGGNSWNELIVHDTLDNFAKVDLSRLFARDSQVLFRVVVTDGANTAEALAAPLTIIAPGARLPPQGKKSADEMKGKGASRSLRSSETTSSTAKPKKFK